MRQKLLLIVKVVYWSTFVYLIMDVDRKLFYNFEFYQEARDTSVRGKRETKTVDSHAGKDVVNTSNAPGRAKHCCCELGQYLKTLYVKTSSSQDNVHSSSRTINNCCLLLLSRQTSVHLRWWWWGGCPRNFSFPTTMCTHNYLRLTSQFRYFFVCPFWVKMKNYRIISQSRSPLEYREGPQLSYVF